MAADVVRSQGILTTIEFQVSFFQSNPFCHYMFDINYINQSSTQLRDNSLKD